MADTPAPVAAPPGGNGSPSLVTEVTGTITVPVVSRTGQQTGTVDIDPAAFGGKISRQLMHDVVLMYLANQRAGTHHTLRRGQVAGSTKKLFRQKGTGNARVGTKRTNKRRGGGTAKGPKPRDYEYHLPKKAVKAATRMAILSKFRDGEAVVLDELSLAAPKTKDVANVLRAIVVDRKTTEAGEKSVNLLDTTVLIGTAALDPNVYKSARNLPNVKVLPAAEFNCYTVLKQKRLLLTRAALDALVNPPAKEKAANGGVKAAEPERVRRGRAGRFQKRKAAGKV
ncbi:MAG: 50S ribosomal protein L4 [Isosphaera sp.]|nr:50S ribosomal protein L4 [Isosphaera sp.]